MSFIDDMFKDTEDVTLSPEVSPIREALEKTIDDPLQRVKETTPKVDGKTSLPPPPKETPKVST